MNDPNWFGKLRLRFVDSGAESRWKYIWSRLMPINDGNPIVLQAPTDTLFKTAARDCQKFFYVVGRPVTILPPET